jgi:hypothetical protein
MPEHYKEWYYEDLPPKPRRAAKLLGYETQQQWDDSEDVSWTTKDFTELSQAERQALRFLGWDPIDQLEDLWWEDVDDTTQEAARVLGWNEHKWDHDWALWDLPIEDRAWGDLTAEERRAARYFGYDGPTWDEEDPGDGSDYESADGEPFGGGKTSKKKKKKPSKPPKSSGGGGGTKLGGKAKPKFEESRMYGSRKGKEFDHRMHPRIKAITVRAGSVVDGISISYPGKTFSNGGTGGKAHTIELERGEWVTDVTVRATDDGIQALTLKTNKGQTLSAGGGGGLFGRKGEEFESSAPEGGQLCGIKGRESKSLDAIALRWGPVPKNL